jgi:hypothetical protein
MIVLDTDIVITYIEVLEGRFASIKKFPNGNKLLSEAPSTARRGGGGLVTGNAQIKPFHHDTKSENSISL